MFWKIDDFNFAQFLKFDVIDIELKIPKNFIS